MIDELKKIMLLGVGAVATSYDKSMELVEELVKKGRLTMDEGKELGEELKRNFQEKTQESLNIKPMTRDKIDEIIAEHNFVSRIEFEALKNRVNELEKKLEEEKK